jgi:hypothetical protein
MYKSKSESTKTEQWHSISRKHEVKYSVREPLVFFSAVLTDKEYCQEQKLQWGNYTQDNSNFLLFLND